MNPAQTVPYFYQWRNGPNFDDQKSLRAAVRDVTDLKRALHFQPPLRRASSSPRFDRSRIFPRFYWARRSMALRAGKRARNAIMSISADHVRLKRAYEAPDPRDGRRILVDRLWPRGVAKGEAAIDEWAKAIAPSTELRKWFGHDPGRWQEFRRRYASEILGNAELLEHLRELARQAPITLVYSARDEAHNDAVVLRQVMLGRPME